MLRTILMMALLLPALAAAEPVSGDIYLSDTGEATFSLRSSLTPEIEGIASDGQYIAGTSEQLTRMQGGVWEFSLELEGVGQSDITLHLPPSTQTITAAEGTNHIIDLENRRIILLDEGDIAFTVHYRLGQSQATYVLPITLAILGLLLAGVSARAWLGARSARDALLASLNEREREIVHALSASPMRYKALREQLGLPKASFARHIQTLEHKGIIERQGEGKNHLLTLRSETFHPGFINGFKRFRTVPRENYREGIPHNGHESEQDQR